MKQFNDELLVRGQSGSVNYVQAVKFLRARKLEVSRAVNLYIEHQVKYVPVYWANQAVKKLFNFLLYLTQKSKS